MTAAPDYYAILQVVPDADAGIIRAAYRSLSQRHHPDKNLGDPARAEEMMKRINEAYATLSDPVRHAAYDTLRRTRAEPSPHPAPPPAADRTQRPAGVRPRAGTNDKASAARTAPPPPVSRPSQTVLPAERTGRRFWAYLVTADIVLVVASPGVLSGPVLVWQLAIFALVLAGYRRSAWLGRCAGLAAVVLGFAEANLLALAAVGDGLGR